jgi:hypothetical protein
MVVRSWRRYWWRALGRRLRWICAVGGGCETVMNVELINIHELFCVVYDYSLGGLSCLSALLAWVPCLHPWARVA